MYSIQYDASIRVDIKPRIIVNLAIHVRIRNLNAVILLYTFLGNTLEKIQINIET